ncbi:unnamed protein product [Ceutorhynchus assimilis]|uniref:Ataxin-2 C-terminal domain-containing protein n=1 Tax=Ceutorhynchus assimilis TaxID=467358 RepID=A0A9N9MD98_9CUCU|nr:unnamed protein product [Ceutorhynchus assimilis]
MKMPPNKGSDNGIFEYEENSLSINSEEIENNGVEDFNSPPDDDFSEYLWMENEEEFDKEVMQRLEEEALMEECIAYMNTENTSPTFYPSTGQGSAESSPAVTSELNPEAAEFVPSSQMERVPAETSTSTKSP